MTKLAQQKVENHFLAGKSLTVKSCSSLYHTTELRVIVSRLRKHFKIKDVKCYEPDGTWYKRYWMPLGTIRNGNRRA